MTDYADIDYDALFGSDSGEDEDPNALRSYFVDLPKFKKFYDTDTPLSIVRGRKGMGKSALLKRQAIKLRDAGQRNNIVISATGNELMGMGNFSGTSQAYLENHWKQVICKRICVEIGKQIKFAASNDSMSMVETAELEGYKGENIVSALTSRIGSLVQKFLSSSDDSGDPELPQRKAIGNAVEALKRFQTEGEKTVWLLIDDIDAKYVDDEENQQRVGAFFSAIRSLAFGVNGLRIRASVRTDVWRNLRRMEDQDKIRGYVIDIEWQDSMLRSIFVKRILSYLQRENFPPSAGWDTARNYEDIVKQVFVPSMKWDNKNVEPFIPVKILAGARPRWMGQLCKLAGQEAGTSLITLENIRQAMREFGGEKIADIQKEHQHQFTDLPKLIDIFRQGKREYNRFQLVSLIDEKYVQKMAGAVPTINGYPYSKPDQLADFLFQIDFLAAHNDGKGNFVTFDKDPDLFYSQENQSNVLKWAVNASYRNYLKIT